MKTVFDHVDKAILDMARIVNLFACDKEILEAIEIELIGSRGKKINILTCGNVKLQAVIEDMNVYLGFGDVRFKEECPLPFLDVLLKSTCWSRITTKFLMIFVNGLSLLMKVVTEPPCNAL